MTGVEAPLERTPPPHPIAPVELEGRLHEGLLDCVNSGELEGEALPLRSTLPFSASGEGSGAVGAALGWPEGRGSSSASPKAWLGLG